MNMNMVKKYEINQNSAQIKQVLHQNQNNGALSTALWQIIRFHSKVKNCQFLKQNEKRNEMWE